MRNNNCENILKTKDKISRHLFTLANILFVTGLNSNMVTCFTHVVLCVIYQDFSNLKTHNRKYHTGYQSGEYQ